LNGAERARFKKDIEVLKRERDHAWAEFALLQDRFWLLRNQACRIDRALENRIEDTRHRLEGDKLWRYGLSAVDSRPRTAKATRMAKKAWKTAQPASPKRNRRGRETRRKT
jgi:hypothetical protein